MSLRSCRSLVVAVVFCLCVSSYCKFPTLDHIKAKAGDKTQSRAVVELLKRLLGNRSTEFIVLVNRSLSNDSLDVCELRSTKNNKIVATGSTAVSVASGIYNYLKYFCNCHVSWSGDQLELPRPLPKLSGVLRISTQHRSEPTGPTSDSFVCFCFLCTNRPTPDIWGLLFLESSKTFVYIFFSSFFIFIFDVYALEV